MKTTQTKRITKGTRKPQAAPPFVVAMAQITTDPGTIGKNVEKIISYINQAKDSGAQLVVFPELAIPAYGAMDLLFDRAYLKENLRGLKKIIAASRDIAIIVGFVDWDPKRTLPGGKPCIWNSSALIENGKLLGVQDKELLPTYDIFDERRYFEKPRARKIFTQAGVRIGSQICEDLWSTGYEVDPSAQLAKAGAELIVNISASPFHVGKRDVRNKLVSSTAKKFGIPLVYTNLVGSFDGYEGEIPFDGGSVTVNAKGKLIAAAPRFAESLTLVQPFAGTPLTLPKLNATAELHDALVFGIKEYFRRIGAPGKANTKRAVIGLSGGIDSAVVAALAVQALGKENVFGVTLPSRFNSQETLSDAQRLAENLGVCCPVLPIEGSVTALSQEFLTSLEPGDTPPVPRLPSSVDAENVQARVRMIHLMRIANRYGGIVLNTGNKTESIMDNVTIYGDSVGGLCVLGDVDKDRVYALANYINQRAGREVIPESTIKRVPTAELKENQIDAMVMGGEPQVIAPLTRAIIEEQLTLEQALKRFTKTFGEPLVRKVFRHLDRSEWKRRQFGPGIRVSSRAFGIGRRVPMSHGYWSEKG